MKWLTNESIMQHNYRCALIFLFNILILELQKLKEILAKLALKIQVD